MIMNKFFFQRAPGNALLPNLYVFLVAPSGVGKGTAINAITEYLKPYREHVKMFSGRTTHSKFMDFLTTPRVGAENIGKLNAADENGCEPSTPGYIVMEELAWGIGDGARAQEFIRLLTAIYTQTGKEFEEMTQMFGHHRMTNPCINALFGTTKPWLLESVGIKNILSGFASRSIWLFEEYNIEKMCAWAIHPHDYHDVVRYIEWRMDRLFEVEGGELFLAPEARFSVDRWWSNWHERAMRIKRGESSEDAASLPLYMRGMDLVLKLSMVLRAADFDETDRFRFKIRQAEVMQAIQWTEQLTLTHYPRLLKMAYKSDDPEIVNVEKVAELIKGFRPGECTRTALVKKAHNRGLNAGALDKGIASLNAQGKVESIPGPAGKPGWFRWVGEKEGSA
jgi:hypothetical protein